MTKELRIGMIGYGFMGRAHSNAYCRVNNFFDLEYRPVLKAVCARNEENAKAFAEKWEGIYQHKCLVCKRLFFQKGKRVYVCRDCKVVPKPFLEWEELPGFDSVWICGYCGSLIDRYAAPKHLCKEKRETKEKEVAR